MKIAKKIMRQFWPYTIGLFEQIAIIGKTPILVYQMGKVGSSTIVNTLKSSNINNPVYHIHFLSSEGIYSIENYYK